MIAWLNKQPKGKIFTKEDISNSKKLKDLSEHYVLNIIQILASKEFYIGKNFSGKGITRKIDSFYKKRNIPTDKSLEDIKWFLRTGVD